MDPQQKALNFTPASIPPAVEPVCLDVRRSCVCSFGLRWSPRLHTIESIAERYAISRRPGWLSARDLHVGRHDLPDGLRAGRAQRAAELQRL